MGSGGVLGASGGQETTREAPKTIFAAKMGGPGLQKGSNFEPKCDKIRCKILVDFGSDFFNGFLLALRDIWAPKMELFGRYF